VPLDCCSYEAKICSHLWHKAKINVSDVTVWCPGSKPAWTQATHGNTVTLSSWSHTFPCMRGCSWEFLVHFGASSVPVVWSGGSGRLQFSVVCVYIWMVQSFLFYKDWTGSNKRGFILSQRRSGQKRKREEWAWRQEREKMGVGKGGM